MKMTGSKSLSEDEIKLYDRQIRLWGLKAQTNLRNSRILIINLTSVGCEIVKNLMLSGIGSLTLIDNSEVLDQDLNVNFFFDESQVGMNKCDASTGRIKEMNPRVSFSTFKNNWEEFIDNNDDENDDIFFKKFNLIVATGLNGFQIEKLNKKTRFLKIPLMVTNTHGLFGFIFNDLIEIENWIKFDKNSNKKVGDQLNQVSEIIEINKLIENDVEYKNCLVKNTFIPWYGINGEHLNKDYPSEKKKLKRINPVLLGLLSLLELSNEFNKPIEDVQITKSDLNIQIDKILKKFKLPSKLINDEIIEIILKNAYCQYQPISAIIGGTLSQDIINTLVGKDVPVNNFAIIDGINNEMPIYKL